MKDVEDAEKNLKGAGNNERCGNAELGEGEGKYNEKLCNKSHRSCKILKQAVTMLRKC